MGLFGVVSGGTIKNINFESVNINTAKAENTVSAVDLLVDNSTVSNVKVLSDTLVGFEGLGGIVGRMTVQGTIKDCENNATISTATSGCKNFGGIVGVLYHAADITSNTNEATSLIINSGNFVAGIVGCFQTTENTQVGYKIDDVDVTFKGNSTCEFITVIDGDKKNLLIFDNSGKIVIQE